MSLKFQCKIVFHILVYTAVMGFMEPCTYLNVTEVGANETVSVDLTTTLNLSVKFSCNYNPSENHIVTVEKIANSNSSDSSAIKRFCQFVPKNDMDSAMPVKGTEESKRQHCSCCTKHGHVHCMLQITIDDFSYNGTWKLSTKTCGETFFYIHINSCGLFQFPSLLQNRSITIVETDSLRLPFNTVNNCPNPLEPFKVIYVEFNLPNVFRQCHIVEGNGSCIGNHISSISRCICSIRNVGPYELLIPSVDVSHNGTWRWTTMSILTPDQYIDIIVTCIPRFMVEEHFEVHVILGHTKTVSFPYKSCTREVQHCQLVRLNSQAVNKTHHKLNIKSNDMLHCVYNVSGSLPNLTLSLTLDDTITSQEGTWQLNLTNRNETGNLQFKILNGTEDSVASERQMSTSIPDNDTLSTPWSFTSDKSSESKPKMEERLEMIAVVTSLVAVIAVLATFVVVCRTRKTIKDFEHSQEKADCQRRRSSSFFSRILRADMHRGSIAGQVYRGSGVSIMIRNGLYDSSEDFLPEEIIRENQLGSIQDNSQDNIFGASPLRCQAPLPPLPTEEQEELWQEPLPEVPERPACDPGTGNIEETEENYVPLETVRKLKVQQRQQKDNCDGNTDFKTFTDEQILNKKRTWNLYEPLDHALCKENAYVSIGEIRKKKTEQQREKEINAAVHSDATENALKRQ